VSGPFPALAGASAIWVKEIRGRMRGPRAFVFITFYLTVLGGLLWAYLRTVEAANQFGGFTEGLPGVEAGRAIFGGAVAILTLIVVALAPAYTTGSISAEREKQTLDLLVVTPITSLAIVAAKLMSGLAYLFLIIAASLPMTAIVFLFGGVGFEDMLKAYIVLLATAIGLGSIGVFYSALMKRTQAATMASYFTVLALTVGALFVASVWNVRAGDGRMQPPPEALLYLNPAIAQADVFCEMSGEGCVTFGSDVGSSSSGAESGLVGDGFEAPFVEEPPARVSFWPKSVVAWLVASAVLLFGAIQLISPTRRWRPLRPADRTPNLGGGG